MQKINVIGYLFLEIFQFTKMLQHESNLRAFWAITLKKMIVLNTRFAMGKQELKQLYLKSGLRNSNNKNI